MVLFISFVAKIRNGQVLKITTDFVLKGIRLPRFNVLISYEHIYKYTCILFSFESIHLINAAFTIIRYEPKAALLPFPPKEEAMRLRPWRLVVGAHDGRPDEWTDHGHPYPTFMLGSNSTFLLVIFLR